MRTALKLALVFSLVFAACPTRLQADVTFYTNPIAWAAAVGWVYQVENFNDPMLIPGMTINGPNVQPIPYYETGWTNAFYGQSVMRDTINDVAGPTVFTFAIPIYAFGGYFDLAGPTGPGTGIKVWVSASPMSPLSEQIPNTTHGSFWGFVSTTGFSSVAFTEGSASGSVETYDLENLHVAPVPEPSTFGLIGAGIAAFLFRLRRRR